MTLSYEEPDVEPYVASKGWQIHKRERGKSGEHLILKACPLCGREAKNRADRNFYINVQNGLWNTYCCDKKGNLLTLKREQGDIDIESIGIRAGTSEGARLAERLKKARGRTWVDYEVPPIGTADYFHKRLIEKRVPSAYEYLTVGRGLTDKTINDFRLGVALRGFCRSCKALANLVPASEEGVDPICSACKQTVPDAYETIAIPYFVDGREVNFKFRSIEGEKRFEKWTGAPTTLFNSDSLEGEFKRVVIAEAELDAITIAQVGYAQVVALGGATKTIEDDWLERLALFDDVLIACDNDEAGEKGADAIAKTLGKYRCKRVRFPMKDANDCLRSGMSEEQIASYIAQASDYSINAVKPASEFIDDVRKMRTMGKEICGRQTQWLGFNKLLSGLRSGEVTVVTGGTGSGKTTFTTALAWDQARGDPANNRDACGVLVASFEEQIPNVVRKIFCMQAGKPFVGNRAMTDGEFENAAQVIENTDLFFVDQYGEMPLSDLRDAIEYGVRRFGLWLVVLDHLHFFLPPTNDERRTIDEAVRSLKKWAVRLGIHLILVVHPAKLRTDSDGKVLKVELNDLKGSSAIKQDADNVIRVWRERGGGSASVPFAEITTLKCRSDFGREDSIILEFDPATMRFTFTAGMSTGTSKKNGKSKPKTKPKPEQQKLDMPPPEPEPEPETGPKKIYVGGKLVRDTTNEQPEAT